MPPMNRAVRPLSFVVICVLSALVLALGTLPPARAAAAGVDWVAAATDAQIDSAFAQARAEGKPLLLYWGAKWCPPCNQLKATLFNRADFAERTRSFVAVQVDGDGPGAQKLGARFKVRGYPTLVLFSSAGVETTRVLGSVEAPQVLEVLELGLAGGRPLPAVLADARAGKPVSSAEWRLLAFHDWGSDEPALVPAPQRAALLASLAARCPAAEANAGTRLWLQAVAARSGAGKATAAERQQMLALLADPAASRAQMDVLAGGTEDLVRVLAPATGQPARAAFITAYDAALARFEADTALSRGDRQSALYARVQLARLALPKDAKGAAVTAALPPALVAAVREQAARYEREVRDPYERQAVIPGAAGLLAEVGLLDESEALLQANLARSISPYYLMSELAAIAKERGDKAAALRWHEQAWAASEGPATRLQWGASYLAALVELAPQDSARIERAAAKLLEEAAAQPGAFYERNARSLQRAGKKLREWNAGGAHADTMARLQRQLGSMCSRVDSTDAQRATCNALLKPAPKPAA